MGIQNDLIVDVGMHKGMDSEFYLKKGFRVVAVEANKALVTEVEERLAEYIESGQFRIYNVGILDKCGEFDFYVNKDKDDWSSAFKSIGSRQGTAYSVEKIKFVTFDKVLSEVGMPYYLKIDIEHADIFALRGLRKFTGRPKYVSCEAHSFDVFYELKKLGYNSFKLVNQKNLHKIKLPNPPLEGNYIDAHFTGIHSGPFGEETPGEWGTLEEAVYEWLHKRVGYPGRSLLGDGWFDVHATFK